MEDSRFAGALVGIAGRLAQSIGLHRDGTVFALPPFETELRRRLWWQIYASDTRISEDHGTTPTVREAVFDTRLPLNINDDDIFPGMTQTLIPRHGWTDMTHTLLRFEISYTLRRINHRLPEFGSPESTGNVLSVDEKRGLIEKCNHRLESEYLSHCNMEDPLSRITANTSRLMLAKMWLMVYLPISGDDLGKDLSPATTYKLFLKSIEVIEYSHLLGREPSTTRRSWVTRLYFEWQAVRFILRELRVKARDQLADRSWKAVESISQDWDLLIAESKEGAVWRPLQKLLVEAKAARDAATAADMSADPEVHPEETVISPSMTTLDSSNCLSDSGHWQTLLLDSASGDMSFQDIYDLDAFSKSIGWDISAAAPVQHIDTWATEDSNLIPTMTNPSFSFGDPDWTVEDYQLGDDQP